MRRATDKMRLAEEKVKQHPRFFEFPAIALTNVLVGGN